MKNLLTATIALLFMGLTGTSFAHHSSAPHFDNTKIVSATGIVTEFAFVNPHAYLYWDVTDENGEVNNWRCEFSSATSMGRNGYTKETFIPGQEITVNGNPARREDYHCTLTSFVYPDGTEVVRNGALPEDKRVGSLPTVIAADAERPVYLDNGQPNISGYWVRSGRGGPPSAQVGQPDAEAGGPAGGERAAGGFQQAGGPQQASGPQQAGGPQQEGGRPAGGGGPRGPQMELTEAGQAVQDAYEQIYDDPSIHCDIGNIFFGWTHDGHVNSITQEDDKITLQYGYMDFVRTIHLDMDEHPENIEPSRGGHSIGHWEGDTLVVDTVGFSQGILHALSGIPNSAEMTTVERFSYDPETKTLTHSYVANDPLFLVNEYSGQSTMGISAAPYEPYNCTELSGDNNRRPEDRMGD